MSDDSPKTAVAWMLFASFSFGSMNALVKWTSPDADVWSMVFVRSIVIGVVIYSICKQRGVNLRVIDQRSMFLLLSKVSPISIRVVMPSLAIAGKKMSS